MTVSAAFYGQSAREMKVGDPNFLNLIANSGNCIREADLQRCSVTRASATPRIANENGPSTF